jgi:hypothetical protein
MSTSLKIHPLMGMATNLPCSGAADALAALAAQSTFAVRDGCVEKNYESK